LDALNTALRKTAHLLEYGIFAFLLYRSFDSARGGVPRRTIAVFCLLISGFYAGLDEIHQLFVPGRGPSLSDCLIDTLGAGLALWIVLAARRTSLTF
jgi:VanZ family protein